MTSFGDVVLFFSDAEIADFAQAITVSMVTDMFRTCERDSFFRPVGVGFQTWREKEAEAALPTLSVYQ
jgi:hypothetical protein